MDFPFRQLQNSLLPGSKTSVPYVGFNILTVSVEVGEILMPTSDWNVFPTASGSLVGFQSVRFSVQSYDLIFTS